MRLPRLIGVDNAVEWIASGRKPCRRRPQGARGRCRRRSGETAGSCPGLVKRAISGELDYKAKRQPKLDKLKLNAIEQMMAFETSKAFVAGEPARTIRLRSKLSRPSRKPPTSAVTRR